jgi:hypothetical protein
MARLSLILILLTLTVKSFSQTISRNVIASAGNSVSIKGYTISSSVGQIPFQTLNDDSYSLTQGFEQATVKLVIPSNEFIHAFPNPVNDYLYLIFSLPAEKDFVISIYNLAGNEIQSILAPKIQSGVQYSIDFINIPAGLYLLHIYDNSPEKKLYKVLKIEKMSKPNR